MAVTNLVDCSRMHAKKPLMTWPFRSRDRRQTDHGLVLLRLVMLGSQLGHGEAQHNRVVDEVRGQPCFRASFHERPKAF